jgi:hypothetical protein
MQKVDIQTLETLACNNAIKAAGVYTNDDGTWSFWVEVLGKEQKRQRCALYGYKKQVRRWKNPNPMFELLFTTCGITKGEFHYQPPSENKHDAEPIQTKNAA